MQRVDCETKYKLLLYPIMKCSAPSLTLIPCSVCTGTSKFGPASHQRHCVKGGGSKLRREISQLTDRLTKASEVTSVKACQHNVHLLSHRRAFSSLGPHSSVDGTIGFQLPLRRRLRLLLRELQQFRASQLRHVVASHREAWSFALQCPLRI